MTHLRKMMLEELQRRHYSEATTRYYIRKVKLSLDISGALPTAWAHSTFGNIKLIFSQNGSCHPAQ